MGYKVLNWYERLAWPPVLLAFLVALGVGGKNLYNVQPAAPATASAVLSFAATIAGFVITFSAMASDFTMYYDPTVSRQVLLASWFALDLNDTQQSSHFLVFLSRILGSYRTSPITASVTIPNLYFF